MLSYIFLHWKLAFRPVRLSRHVIEILLGTWETTLVRCSWDGLMSRNGKHMFLGSASKRKNDDRWEWMIYWMSNDANDDDVLVISAFAGGVDWMILPSHWWWSFSFLAVWHVRAHTHSRTHAQIHTHFLTFFYLPLSPALLVSSFPSGCVPPSFLHRCQILAILSVMNNRKPSAISGSSCNK